MIQWNLPKKWACTEKGQVHPRCYQKGFHIYAKYQIAILGRGFRFMSNVARSIFYLQPFDGQLWFDVARWVLILNQLGCACVWERALVSFVNLCRFVFFNLSFLMNFNSICWCKVEYYWVCKLPCESLQVPTKLNLFWIIVTAE